MSDSPFDTSRHRRLVRYESFLESMEHKLDWKALDADVAAIERKVGMTVSQPLLRIGLLCHWLGLDANELEDECRERPALASFVSTAAYGPLVDLWLYQQLAPRMKGAAVEFAQLADAIEDALASGGPVRSGTYEMVEPVRAVDSQWAQATLVAPCGLARWAEPFGGTAGDQVRTSVGEATSSHPKAIVLWPWGEATNVDQPVKIGRDPEFSAYADRLSDDRWISRQHVVLEPVPNGVMIRDMGSSNGTRADNVHIGRMHSRLIDGDCTVHLGPSFSCKIVFYPVA